LDKQEESLARPSSGYPCTTMNLSPSSTPRTTILAWLLNVLAGFGIGFLTGLLSAAEISPQYIMVAPPFFFWVGLGVWEKRFADPPIGRVILLLPLFFGIFLLAVNLLYFQSMTLSAGVGAVLVLGAYGLLMRVWHTGIVVATAALVLALTAGIVWLGNHLYAGPGDDLMGLGFGLPVLVAMWQGVVLGGISALLWRVRGNG
jgi:hypothetical protein